MICNSFLPVYPSWLSSCPQCFVPPLPTMDDLVKRFEADVLRLTRKPLAMLKPDGKAARLALVERVTRALVNDSGVTLSVTSTDVVVRTGGCLDSEQAACDREGSGAGASWWGGGGVVRGDRQRGGL